MEMKTEDTPEFSRRRFIQGLGAGAAALGALSVTPSLNALELPRDANGNVIPGFGEEDAHTQNEIKANAGKWEKKSDRKIRVGIAGFGICQFGAQFSYQNHPNVEVVAASDLDPGRCQNLANAVRAKKTYPSCEEMIKDKNIEAVYIATDAPSHARLAIMALNHDKHVVTAVPAVFGFDAEEDAEKLFEAVKKSGKKYMMNETSTFHPYVYEKRMQYQAGALGKIIYSEGEYWHDKVGAMSGYNAETGKIDANGWRKGLTPMWYPTHSTAYYISVTGGGRLTDVSCLGTPGVYPEYKDSNNPNKNPFGTEIAMFKTSEGGMSRMGVSWDMKDAHGVQGRIYGQKPHSSKINGARPPLPPGVAGGGHKGSHGPLTSDFIESILLDRKPIVDISEALNMTLSGVIAHKSALKDGEWMKVPQYNL
jgi:predicted dehydrogenase